MLKLIYFLPFIIFIITNVNCDMMRKSIVFDLKTPKVFYCPQQKPKNMDKLIVRAIPLEKLCEYEGGEIPKDNESDCYNDIDETDYACSEKQRILLRINPPKDSETTTMYPSPDAPEYIIKTKKEIYEKKVVKVKQKKFKKKISFKLVKNFI